MTVVKVMKGGAAAMVEVKDLDSWKSKGWKLEDDTSEAPAKKKTSKKKAAEEEAPAEDE